LEGHQNATLLIGGPCSVESEDQIRDAAQLLVGMGLTTLRGGCYKPRTSPYSFQGLGLEGATPFGQDERRIWIKCDY
jgi:3-deoxy-7-phosphoheptulonate synthase